MQIRNILLLLTLVICSYALNLKNLNHQNKVADEIYDSFVKYRDTLAKVSNHLWNTKNPENNEISIDRLLEILEETEENGNRLMTNKQVAGFLKIMDFNKNEKIGQKEFNYIFFLFSSVRLHKFGHPSSS